MLERAPAAVRLLGLAAVVGTSLVLSGAAGAEAERRSASVRLVGSIEVRGNFAAGASTLTYSARAQIDVTVTQPRDFVSLPLPNDWTGTNGPCRWDRRGSVGLLNIDFHGLAAGRPVITIGGSGGSAIVECDDGSRWGAEPVWRFDEVPDGSGGLELKFDWFDIQDGLGTGSYSLSCSSCPPPSAGSYRVRAAWGISVEFTPERLVAGRSVRMREPVVLLERSNTDTFWSPVRSRNVTVRCDVYYQRPRTRTRKVVVRGYWRAPSEGGSGSDVNCRWRIPKSARGGTLGVTPYLTYRGKTLTPLRGRPRALFRRSL